MLILHVALLMLHHLSHPYKKNINYFACFLITVRSNDEKYFAFFGAVSKCRDISFAPQSALSSVISLFKIKRLFWRLVSPDWKDAINANFQTFLFLLDISLKYRLFFTDNLWRLEFKWSKNLAEGWSPSFPGLSALKLYYLRFHEKINNIFYKVTHS